ncbi:unnamed protein product [Urochloa humidicola]
MAESPRPPELRCGSHAIANLPEEILSEILLLLPPKSILRSRPRPGAPSPPTALSCSAITAASRPGASSPSSTTWAATSGEARAKNSGGVQLLWVH